MKSNIAQSQETFAQRSAKKELFAELGKHKLYDKIGVYKATNAMPNKWSRLTLNSKNNIILVPCPE